MTNLTNEPFARHGIDHISASSLRVFKDNLAVWIGRYLLKVPDEAGPRAWRGQAVEAGLDQALFYGASHDTAMSFVMRAWNERAQGLADDDTLKEQALLPAYLAQAMEALKDKPIPLTRQSRISITLPGIEVPLIGYTDYRWHDHGVDLKTTARIPSQASPDHVEQMSGYMMATGIPFSLVYASAKRWAVFDVTPMMAADGYDRLVESAHAMRSFLCKVEDGRDALTIVAPDYTSFYFTPPMIEAVRAAKRPVEVLP
jgi:hypothetical protein